MLSTPLDSMMYIEGWVIKAWLLYIEGLRLAWQLVGRVYKGERSTIVRLGDVSHSKLNLVADVETLSSLGKVS
jgi:hypothetical protein